MSIIQRLANRVGLYSASQVETRMRTMFGNFQAALTNRLTQDWTTSTLSADSQSKMDLATLRSRCRDLRDNNDFASKFIGMIIGNVLGEGGIHFRSGVKSPDLVKGGELIPGTPDVYVNKTVEDAFYDWGRDCTVHGGLTWCDVQRIVLGSTATDGEILVEKVVTDANPYGFALRLMESDYIDDQYNGEAENGNEVRMGVEMDDNHRKIAYFLWPSNPSDSFFFRRSLTLRTRVNADRLIHLGLPSRPEQTRYLPWMRTAAYRLQMLGEYEKAESIAKRIEASKVGFLKPPTETGFPREFTGIEEPGTGNLFDDTEPGSFKQLPAGWEVEAVDWKRDSQQYEIFVKSSLRSVSAGLGVSYNDLASDMESVNFASGKIGIQAQRELFKALQYWFIEKFCEEVFGAWLKAALMSGGLGNLPPERFTKFNAPVFTGRRWDSIDPQKDVDAVIRKMNAGLTSLRRELAKENINRDELLNEIEEDKRAAELRGLVFPELQPKNAIDAGKNGQANEANGTNPEDGQEPG